MFRLKHDVSQIIQLSYSENQNHLNNDDHIHHYFLSTSNMTPKKPVSNASLAPSSYINMRYISLVCLTLQTTTIIILYSYSRKIPDGQVRYLSSTVVVLAEILKIFFCLGFILKDAKYSLARCLSTLNTEIFLNLRESIKVLIPASLYALQNNLAFYALNNLDPASYQVAYQLKILTTAIFSVLIVKRRIKQKQWFALSLLFAGVALVQMPQDDGPGINSAKLARGHEQNRLLGLLSVIACCMSSGFSGVYFERLIKLNPKQDLWIRNLQLAILCLTMSSIAMFYQDYEAIMTDGLLQGYSKTVWIVVFLQAFGGLIVAAVVKHADNILKGFATSLSIIFSTLLSFYLFETFNPSLNFYIGSTVVIISTIMYSS